MKTASPFFRDGIVLFALTGCDSRPGEGFLELVRKDHMGSASPEITVRVGRTLEEAASQALRLTKGEKG